MHPWHDVRAARVTPDRFLALIEISKASKNKYELDKETDKFVTKLWILGISVMLIAGAGIFAAIKYKINQEQLQEIFVAVTLINFNLFNFLLIFNGK